MWKASSYCQYASSRIQDSIFYITMLFVSMFIDVMFCYIEKLQTVKMCLLMEVFRASSHIYLSF